MSLTEWALVATTAVAVATAIAGIVRDRRKPELDEAQAESALVNSDSVKQQIKRMSDESNMRRDLRILDLEDWADLMRSWISTVAARDNQLLILIRQTRERCEMSMPAIDPLEPPPKFPPPRPLS